MKLSVSFAAVVVCVLTLRAQAPGAGQVELDKIAARAQDAQHPQPPVETDKQLADWAAKFGGTIQHIEVDDPSPNGKTPPPVRMRTVCKTTSKNGHTCRLIKAEQSGGGKMVCTYACS